jgi:hypothetical protein
MRRATIFVVVVVVGGSIFRAGARGCCLLVMCAHIKKKQGTALAISIPRGGPPLFAFLAPLTH